MTVMEEENRELRERLAGLTTDTEPAEGAEETDSAAADAAAKDRKVRTGRQYAAFCLPYNRELCAGCMFMKLIKSQTRLLNLFLPRPGRFVLTDEHIDTVFFFSPSPIPHPICRQFLIGAKYTLKV